MAFSVVFDRIVPAGGKYMATLFNTLSTRKVVVNRIYVFNWQLVAVTGVQLEQELRGITARTVGTAVTPVPEDSNDTLTVGITTDTGSTAVTEGGKGLIRRFLAVSEEHVLATANTVITGALAQLHDAQLVYWRKEGSKGLVLRLNQGITIKNITASTVGSVSYCIEFNDEAA